MSNLRGLKVNQWRAEWNEVVWKPNEHRAEPPHWFCLFSIRASTLRAWSGVNPRSTTSRRHGKEDLGIQRRHEASRSEEIAAYVKFGYPLSAVNQRKRADPENATLRKPGWLPTAIVLNILLPTDKRGRSAVSIQDQIEILEKSNGSIELVPPKSFSDGDHTWRYRTIAPIEVIDGQHRLWAFDESGADDFELPVVAYVGLDLSWQAYLFYTINIKPKKINPSLAFDLYPLLRTEDWLSKFEGHIIYRETRAQELVDLIWSHPKSVWFHRINMLGESGLRGKMVTQAAWIRALLATYVRKYEGSVVRLGGLFGAQLNDNSEVLPWTRVEQAAFLIHFGATLMEAVSETPVPWSKRLREISPPMTDEEGDPAFFGEYSLLSQDQGIRSILHVSNDIFYLKVEDLSLNEVFSNDEAEVDDTTAISQALKELLCNKALVAFFKELSLDLAKYDWQSASTPGLSDDARIQKAAFRGSGGYKELRLSLLTHISSQKSTLGTLVRDSAARLGLTL